MRSRPLCTDLRRHRCALALAVLFAALTSVAGCNAPRLSSRRIPIAHDIVFDLLAPADLGSAISLEQLVDARYGERDFSFHCSLEVDPSQLVLVGLTPFGTRAFTLTLRDEVLSLDMPPGANLPAEPARILADLQLALWPDLSAVRGLQVVERLTPEGTAVREFSRDGDVVIRVTYDDPVRWQKHLRFEHFEQGYSLDVRTLRVEMLSP